MPSSRRPSASGLTGDDLAPPPPQNGTGTGASPAQSSTSNESFYSAAPDVALNGAGGGLKGPWNRVDVLLQKDFAREKKAGKLTFERRVELYGEKLEDRFKELEERLLCREEEVLLKGRELQRLKAENYLLTCRVESISSPSKSAPRIFQTSPEHPNARIIITPPYHSKPRPVSVPGDIFAPQPPSKARQRAITNTSAADDGRRTSGRKRTLTKYDDLDSSESDSLEEYSRRRKAQKTEKDQSAQSTLAKSENGPRRRKSSSKLLESTEGGAGYTPTKREDKEKKPPKPKDPNKPPREKEARLDRRENEDLYESLQKQVTIELLKRRGIPTPEQEQMVVTICKQLALESNTDLVTRAITSVRYWVAHKSWRLRDHFKVLGQRYKQSHRDENWTNALPPVSVVRPLTSQSEVETWLFQSLGMRLAQRRMMSNPDIRRALWIVFVGGLRYGIRSAYDNKITKPLFQQYIESLDVFTKDFEYPVNETTGFRGKMKVVNKDGKEEDVEAPEEEMDDPLAGTWEFDWEDGENVLKDVMVS